MFKKIIAITLAFFAAAAFASVDINKANLAELEGVKGVGTVTAGKIIEERKKGSFKDWTDVQQRMHGIKDARATKLSNNGLTVNGEAYKSTGETPKASGKGSRKAAFQAADKASDAKASKKKAVAQ